MTRDVTSITIRAIGTPAPQGSFFARIVGKGREQRAIVVTDSKTTAPWRTAVIEAAGNAIRATRWLQLNEPTDIEIVFLLHRPPSIPKTRVWPAVRPDLDKYARSTLDALTIAGVITDDSRVVRLLVEKRYVEPGQPPGAVIHVRAISDQGALL